MIGRVEIVPLAGIPELGPGDALGGLIAAAATATGLALAGDDIVVVSQKAVSKAEGMIRELDRVAAGDRARELATRLGKDARLVELVLAESRRVVRAERRALIAETHHGWICANAGIDSSNVPGRDTVALLPLDPDASARRIRAELAAAIGVRPAVIVADSFGRPWRRGQADVAIGSAGVLVLDDWRGRRDRHGRQLRGTAIAAADELASAADLARDKRSATPVVVVRGAGRLVTSDDGPGAGILRRDAGEDLFR